MAFKKTDGEIPHRDVRNLSMDDHAGTLRNLLMVFAYAGDVKGVEAVLDQGLAVDTLDPDTGLSALHIAVGRDDINLVACLTQRGASFMPDRHGRMPTTIAAQCEVSGELCDYIADAEAAAVGM